MKILREMDLLIGDHKLSLTNWSELCEQVDLSNDEVVKQLANILITIRNEVALKFVIELMKTASPETQSALAYQVMWKKGKEGRIWLGDLINVPEVLVVVKEFEELE